MLKVFAEFGETPTVFGDDKRTYENDCVVCVNVVVLTVSAFHPTVVDTFEPPTLNPRNSIQKWFVELAPTEKVVVGVFSGRLILKAVEVAVLVVSAVVVAITEWNTVFICVAANGS